MAAQALTTATTPVNPTVAEAALSACGPIQMEGCVEILRALASEAGDAASFADRASRYRKAFGFLAGAGHNLAFYGSLEILGDGEDHPDAVLIDTFVRLKSAWALCDLVAAPDWSEEQDRLHMQVDEAEGAFFAIAPMSAEGMRMQIEQFLVTNVDGDGTSGAFANELRANAQALAERERAGLRPLTTDPTQQQIPSVSRSDLLLEAVSTYTATIASANP